MTSIIAKNQEPIVEPELPICDAHHHLWDRPGRPYLLDHFIADLQTGHNIVSTVGVECHEMFRTRGPEELRPVGEVEFLEQMADRAAAQLAGTCRVIAAIVGFADLSRGDDVAAVLDAHHSASPQRLRGIRHSTTWDESEAIRDEAPRGLLADPRFRRGLAQLQRYGLSFDAWLYHPQIPELVALARALPQTQFILDHVGAPLGTGPYAGKSSEVFQLWSRGMAELASCANVAIKIGGFGSLRSGYDWHQREVKPASAEIAAAIRPYVEFCIERFGVSRCMFESNFPVEKSSNSYVNLWNAFKTICAGCSEAEKRALFRATAERLYRIN